MSRRSGTPPEHPSRPAVDRLADHRSIDALAEELLPALIAKLGASGLGEIEVREGDWRIRLRRPEGAGPAGGRRVEGRSGRAAGRVGATAEADDGAPRAHPGRSGPRRATRHGRCHAGLVGRPRRT